MKAKGQALLIAALVFSTLVSEGLAKSHSQKIQKKTSQSKTNAKAKLSPAVNEDAFPQYDKSLEEEFAGADSNQDLKPLPPAPEMTIHEQRSLPKESQVKKGSRGFIVGLFQPDLEFVEKKEVSTNGVPGTSEKVYSFQQSPGLFMGYSSAEPGANGFIAKLGALPLKIEGEQSTAFRGTLGGVISFSRVISINLGVLTEKIDYRTLHVPNMEWGFGGQAELSFQVLNNISLDLGYSVAQHYGTVNESRTVDQAVQLGVDTNNQPVYTHQQVTTQIDTKITNQIQGAHVNLTVSF